MSSENAEARLRRVAEHSSPRPDPGVVREFLVRSPPHEYRGASTPPGGARRREQRARADETKELARRLNVLTEEKAWP
jgi:hypothetical protein